MSKNLQEQEPAPAVDIITFVTRENGRGGRGVPTGSRTNRKRSKAVRKRAHRRSEYREEIGLWLSAAAITAAAWLLALWMFLDWISK